VDPALQKLPYHETGEGPWVGAEGNLGASSGWGTALLMFTLLAAVLYIGVFSGLNYRKGLRGRHLLPHRSFWVEVAGLVQDGVQLSGATVRGEQRPRAGGGSGSDRRQNVGGGSSKKKEKKKEKTKEKKKGRQRDQEELLTESLVAEAASSRQTASMISSNTSMPPPLPPPPQSSVSEGGQEAVGDREKKSGGVHSAAAGDGGRWVRVPE
jgi:hypothetical protein